MEFGEAQIGGWNLKVKGQVNEQLWAFLLSRLPGSLIQGTLNSKRNTSIADPRDSAPPAYITVHRLQVTN
jgi:hypothetical protein